MKTILFAHSGGSQAGPGEGSHDFIEVLRRELGPEWEIRFPLIADPEAPDYAMWESLFATEFPRCPEGVILLGHSLGGSMLLKYLSEQSVKANISAFISVSAPWWGPAGWDVEEFVLRPDFAARLPRIPEIHFFHAEKDPVVPFAHLALYRKALPEIQAHALRREDHAFEEGLPELTTLLRLLP